METTGPWDDYLGNGLVSAICIDAQTIRIILCAVIYPSISSIDGEDNSSFVILTQVLPQGRSHFF